MNCNTNSVAGSPVSTNPPCAGFVPSIGDIPLQTRRFPVHSSSRNRTLRVHVRKDLEGSAQLSAKIALRDELTLKHLPLVKVIALSLHRSLPEHVDLDDMVHAGILGLLDAASKYDSEKHVIFSGYAKHRIRGAIIDSLRQLDWASRDMRRRHKQVEAAIHDLAGTLQRAPIEAEIAEKLGMDVTGFRAMMVNLGNLNLFSTSTRANENQDYSNSDYPDKPEGRPDQIFERQELRNTLSEAVTKLPDRYQRVVLMYYNKEMTMKEIGEVLGINESRVSQIHKSALEKMSTVLETIGITSSQAF